MKIIEQYYGPARDPMPWDRSGDLEAIIRVDVGGRQLIAKQHIQGYAPAPYKYVMQSLQRQIMEEVRKEVFGG